MCGVQYLHYSIYTGLYAQCVDTDSECSHQVCPAAASSQQPGLCRFSLFTMSSSEPPNYFCPSSRHQAHLTSLNWLLNSARSLRHNGTGARQPVLAHCRTCCLQPAVT